MILFLFGMLTLIFVLAKCFVSWLVTCFIIWFIAGCFGLTITWQVTTGIWLVIVVSVTLSRLFTR